MSSINEVPDQGQAIELIEAEHGTEVAAIVAEIRRVESRIMARIDQIEADAKAQADAFMSPDGMMKMAEQFLGVPPVPGR